MRFPDQIRIARTRPGTTDENTGTFTPGSVDVLYEGEADVQTIWSRTRGLAGERDAHPTAVAYLPEYVEAQLAAVKPDDTAEVTYGAGLRQVGEVATVIPMETAVVVRFTGERV